MKRLLFAMFLMALVISNTSALLEGGGGIYSNNVSFYIITPPTGTMTNYPVMVTLTNQSGISGLYGELDNTRPNIVVYTNGTTRPDWYDINFTNSDGSSPIPFWIENGTANTTSSFAWILTTTNTTYAVYYGNSSQSISANGNNIYNVFPYGEDYSVNTLNTTQTVVTAVSGGSYAISDGIAVITGGTSARERLRSVKYFLPGNSTRSRFKTSSDASAAFAVGFGGAAETNGAYISGATAAKSYSTVKAGVSNNFPRDSTLTTYTVGEISRYGVSTVNFSENNVYINKSIAQIPTVELNATAERYGSSYTTSVDWQIVRPCVYPEPSASSFVTYGGSTLVSSFTSNITIANTPVVVQFTDTSAGSPEQWNWTFGDGTYSTLQNPSHTYATVGLYNVSLLASTASENKTSSNTTLYFQRSAVTIGDSIARGLYKGRIYNPYGAGVEWEPTYLPQDNASSYEGEMQFNHTPFEQWDWRYNMGWGGDTTTGVKNRWLRDAIGQEVYLADTLPNYTIDNKTPSVILLNVGINDITSSVAASTIENNIWYCVNDANTRGIPIIVISIFPKSTNTAAIQTINTWEEAMFDGNISMPNVRWVDAYTFLDDGSGNIKAPYNNGDNIHITPTGFIDLTSKIYTENSDLFDVVTLSAEFTQSPNPSTINQAVTFTDTSTDNPTTWNWTIDGSVTNTTQNIAYTFTTAGTYSIDLNVTNSTGSFSNMTHTQIVTNVTSFTQQDIYLTGQYTITFNVKSSTTNLPIANVTVVDSVSGQSYPSTNGTAFLTLPAGLYYINFIADGYQTKQVTYVVDQDETHEVKMVPGTTPTGGTQNTWYTPWQVRLRIVDYYGSPLSNINVTANYVASTLPSTDTSWLISAFGVNEGVANDMLNSSMAMAGDTDDNGGLSFTMFKSLQYRLTITNTTLSVASTKTLYPSDQEYVIYVRTAGQGVANNTLAMRNGTLPWYSVNSTHINLNMTYVDTSLCTSDLTFRVWFRDNGTEVHNTTWSGFGAGYVYDNHTVPKAPIGTEYLWGYNATTVC